MTKPRTIPITIHVAIDSDGKWFAWGSGITDNADLREEALCHFNRALLNDLDMVGNDEADLERFVILAEIPIPDHVVWASEVKLQQRELFGSATEPS